MMKNKRLLPLLLAVLSGVLFNLPLLAQTVENDFDLRSELKVSMDLTGKLKLVFIPEIRWDNELIPDNYLLESRLYYEVIKGLSLQGAYRFIINPRSTKTTQYFHRFAIGASYEKKINRWEPSIRFKYTNYTEDASSGDFFRMRLKLDYDLPDSHLTPSVSAEGFYAISGSEIYKYRYATGLDYKINKQNSVGIGYLFDYYMQEYKNRHILILNYKYKF